MPTSGEHKKPQIGLAFRLDELPALLALAAAVRPVKLSWIAKQLFLRWAHAFVRGEAGVPENVGALESLPSTEGLTRGHEPPFQMDKPGTVKPPSPPGRPRLWIEKPDEPDRPDATPNAK